MTTSPRKQRIGRDVLAILGKAQPASQAHSGAGDEAAEVSITAVAGLVAADGAPDAIAQQPDAVNIEAQSDSAGAQLPADRGPGLVGSGSHSTTTRTDRTRTRRMAALSEPNGEREDHPLPQDGKRRPKIRQGKGGAPLKHDAGSAAVTVLLTPADLDAADRMQDIVRQSQRQTISRSALLRACLLGVAESGLDFSGVASEQQLIQLIRSRLRPSE